MTRRSTSARIVTTRWRARVTRPSCGASSEGSGGGPGGVDAVTGAHRDAAPTRGVHPIGVRAQYGRPRTLTSTDCLSQCHERSRMATANINTDPGEVAFLE